MTSESDVPAGSGVTSERAAPVYVEPREVPWLPPSRPRVVVKHDLLPSLTVLSTAAVLGLPCGWIWSRLAPPETVLVLGDPNAGDNGVAPLAEESWHRFDALAVFLLIGLVAGILTGAAVWLLRERRGPVVLIGAILGSLVAAWLAMRTGASFADGRYLDALTSAAPDSIARRPPVLETGWAIVAQPLGVALAYATAVAWNGRPDLGRRLG